MTNQQLLDFIKAQNEKGINKETISRQLLAGGWNFQDIEEGFKALGISSTNTSSVPISPFNSTPQIKKHSGLKILLIILVLFLLAGGVSAYYFKDKLVNLPIVGKFFVNKNTMQVQGLQNNTVIPDTIDAVKNIEVLNQANEREYKNIEAGFSFKYPAEYGEIIVTKDSPDGIGYAFLGLTTEPEKFSFNFFTKDFLIGDADPSKIHNGMHDTCNQPGTSCESIPSKNGSMLKLATRQGVATYPKNYLLMATLSSDTDYRDLSFSSLDRSILINIASQLEISN